MKSILPDMTASLAPGERVQIRRQGERRWKDYTVRRPIEFRTTGRHSTWLYGEYLNFQVRKTVSATDPRRPRY